MTLYEELQARGLVAQITDNEIIDLINNGKATFYIGFDCTADSLTAGHFMALTLMKRLQMAGNKPIALIGGGTTMIGDPSGRTDMRKMLTKEDIAHNAACFKKQMEKFIDFSDDKALMLNNADWLLNLNYVELLRDVGACFSVNNMLRAKCYEQRMERGLSFLEFNYMIMQSYDFYYMFQHYGCNMQFGGDDQWSNMLGGTELIRRKLGKDAYAMTITLLTDSQGKKMGKTAGNAVWLDPNKTSPFEFYQYWRNVGDADVMKCIRMLTFLPLEQIDEMSTWKDQRLNEAKEILAYELTSMVHGKEEAEKAQAAARALFGGAAMDTEHMPSTQLTEADLTDGSIGILTLMVKSGLAASNGEARRLVVQGGVLADGEKVADPTVSFTAEQLKKGVVIKKGKKVYHRSPCKHLPKIPQKKIPLSGSEPDSGIFCLHSAEKQDVLPLGHVAGSHHSDIREGITVGYHNRSGQGITIGTDLLQVKFQQKLSAVDMFACPDLRSKSGSMPFHRVHSNMNQKVHAGITPQTDGMTAFGNFQDHTVCRSIDLSLIRFNGTAFAQNLRRKYRILDSIQRKKLSLQRRSNEHSTFRREEGNDRCFRVPFFPIIRKDLTDQKDNTCHSQANQPGQQKPEQHAVCRDPAVPCQNGGCDSNGRSCHCFG